MDPQKLSQLDPKLRDAYQRVMGTPVPAPQPEPTPTPNPTIEEPSAIPTTPQQPPIPEPQPAIPQEPPVQASNFVQMNSEVAATPSSSANFTAPAPQAQTMVVKKKNGIMIPILFGIVGLVFIVIYTLFWTKIFNFKLPFLP